MLARGGGDVSDDCWCHKHLQSDRLLRYERGQPKQCVVVVYVQPGLAACSPDTQATAPTVSTSPASADDVIRGYTLKVAPTASTSPASADPVLTCKGTIFKASEQATPRQIDGGLLRIQVGREIITVTTAEGGGTSYRVEGTHDGWLDAGTRGSNGDQYYVHVSVSPPAFIMMRVVGGQPKGAVSGSCR